MVEVQGYGWLSEEVSKKPVGVFSCLNQMINRYDFFWSKGKNHVLRNES